jgi:hypothetical protein
MRGGEEGMGGGGEGVEINVYEVMTKVMTSSRIIAAERRGKV